ncbi:Cyclochlorotine biosynthesis protein [Lachnellula subtilissima]|uniref:Cyclochlorotine biosynthesis protein n=1 Tax=Lachnellula subtilissima TaxID=602034 RepID=A0A8H8RK78_9HELO|nr:Cyclochlorotine biosynthesis protein [Lachnellula subtilissima]
MLPHSEPRLSTTVEKHPLLGDEEDEESESIYKEGDLKLSKRLPARRVLWTHVVISLVTLFLGFTIGFAVSYYMKPEAHQLQTSTYSPAQTVISYSQQRIHPQGPETYWGTPTVEQTKSWERLLEPVMMRASYEEMALAGEDPDNSIKLLDGGYLASLGVYHDLHCLRRIRFFLYADHFYPDMTEKQRVNEQRHVEHCLEALRVSTMCTGSTGLWSFEWQPNVTKAHAKTDAQRSCVDWDALDNWTRERAVGFNPPLKPRPQGL